MFMACIPRHNRRIPRSVAPTAVAQSQRNWLMLCSARFNTVQQKLNTVQQKLNSKRERPIAEPISHVAEEVRSFLS